MINITQKNDKYIPIKKVGNGIKICFNYEPYLINNEDGSAAESELGTWTEEIFPHMKSLAQIKDFILKELNRRIDNKILSGFRWKDMVVWLSSENQFNYTVAYNLAIQSNGASLPSKFKFGTTDEPVYYEFTTLEDLQDFYLGAVGFINQTLEEGWIKKDSINWDDYNPSKLIE